MFMLLECVIDIWEFLNDSLCKFIKMRNKARAINIIYVATWRSEMQNFHTVNTKLQIENNNMKAHSEAQAFHGKQDL